MGVSSPEMSSSGHTQSLETQNSLLYDVDAAAKVVDSDKTHIKYRKMKRMLLEARNTEKRLLKEVERLREVDDDSDTENAAPYDNWL